MAGWTPVSVPVCGAEIKASPLRSFIVVPSPVHAHFARVCLSLEQRRLSRGGTKRRLPLQRRSDIPRTHKRTNHPSIRAARWTRLYNAQYGYGMQPQTETPHTLHASLVLLIKGAMHRLICVSIYAQVSRVRMNRTHRLFRTAVRCPSSGP